MAAPVLESSAVAVSEVKMELATNIGNGLVRGNVTLWQAAPITHKEQLASVKTLSRKQNQIQFEWGAIAAQCIGFGNRDYRVSAMYIEFENVDQPEDEVEIPTFERSDGLSYYDDLVLDDSRDFIRVPLLFQPTLGISAGYEDYFTEGLTGNNLTFYAQTTGTTGFYGKTFSTAANSKIAGVALVSTPVFGDRSRDLVLARTYFAPEDQAIKETSTQAGVTWTIRFS